MTMIPRNALPTLQHETGAEADQAQGSGWRNGFVILAIAFAGSQVLDFATAQGLSSIEPRGYFAETNLFLAQITDPVIRARVGFATRVALVVFVVWVARVKRRRAVDPALLFLGTLAGLFGAWSNWNPWR